MSFRLCNTVSVALHVDVLLDDITTSRLHRQYRAFRKTVESCRDGKGCVELDVTGWQVGPKTICVGNAEVARC